MATQARPAPLPQGLKFDLIVYSPYKAIDGFLEDIQAAVAEAGSGSGDTAAGAGLDPGMAALGEEQLAAVRSAAYSAADALMLSDAPLLHAPGRLALAALRSGLGKVRRLGWPGGGRAWQCMAGLHLSACLPCLLGACPLPLPTSRPPPPPHACPAAARHQAAGIPAASCAACRRRRQRRRPAGCAAAAAGGAVRAGRTGR